MKSVEFVAEFTTNPMGHYGLLERMTYAAAASGASAIKMQKKNVESFYSAEKLGESYKSPFGQNYRDYRSIFEFSETEWSKFNELCASLEIPWFATAQDLDSLNFLLSYEPKRLKVASINAANESFLRKIERRIDKQVELVISTAGKTLQQIENALEIFSKHTRIWVLHCVAEYPCPEENLKLGNIPVLIEEFADDRIRVGYSGHEEGIDASIAAVQLGAEMVERHFCMSRHSFVHHIECSLEPAEFKTLVAESAGSRSLNLKDISFTSNFQMSARERDFLEGGQYHTKFLGKSSAI